MKETITLSDCITGEKITLESVDDKQLSVQLYCMGCIPGENLRIERIAPFGDPILISIEDSFISLRKEDAAKMQVKRI